MFHRDLTRDGLALGKGRVTGPTQIWLSGTNGLNESSPAIGDINGDGKAEVVMGSFDGNVYAVAGATGQPVWPQPFKTGYWVWSSAAIGDINRDGQTEVVIGSNDHNLYVLNGRDGTLKWSYQALAEVWSSPALVDVDGDGHIEILFGSEQVYALDAITRRPKWIYLTGAAVFVSSPAVADIDRDGELEIAIGALDNNLHLIGGRSGSAKWTFAAGGPVESSPAFGDINGDGRLEVIFGTSQQGIYALDSRGQRLWFFPTGTDVRVPGNPARIRSSPALGDINGDGQLEAVIGANDGHIYAFRASSGSLLWQVSIGNYVESSPTIGDIDGDGRMEVLCGTHGAYMLVLDGATGREKWRFAPNGSAEIVSSPSLGDINGDGFLEIVIGANSGAFYALGSR
jgi:outer membrane protein assembly factor BamB